MRKILLLALFAAAAFQIQALDGRWVLEGFVSQTIIEDSVFFADDHNSPLIREIVFKKGRLAELFMKLDTDSSGEWHSAEYKMEDGYLVMTIIGFGEVRMFYKKVLPDRILLSFTAVIGPDGISAVSPKQPEEQPSFATRSPEPMTLETIDPPAQTGDIAMQEPKTDAAESVEMNEKAETKQQLLVFSAYFVLKK